MSWSVSFIGKPEAVAAALEAEAAKLTGTSREEYDAALPHLVGLVKQNFRVEGDGYRAPLVQVTASGSGYTRDGAAVQRACTVRVESLYSELVS